MCCLTNEEENYEELNSQLPSVGDTVTTCEGLSWRGSFFKYSAETGKGDRESGK